MTIAGNMRDYAQLARIDKPIGALLLLWPTLWGLWIAAEGAPGWEMLAIFIGGVFVMRALGCVINDIADRKLDAQVARTKDRPLASGRISITGALVFAFLLLLSAFLLWLLLPPLAKLWAVGGLLLAAAYPFAKRFMALPQAVLGVAFGFGIVVAFAAVRGENPPPMAFYLMAANWFWVMAYDTIYAMCDRDDDIKAGAKSAAILFGRRDIVYVSLFYAAAVLSLSALGLIYHWGIGYQVALIAAMLWVIRLFYWYRLRDPHACLAAFRANNWFGAFVFAGFVAAFA